MAHTLYPQLFRLNDSLLHQYILNQLSLLNSPIILFYLEVIINQIPITILTLNMPSNPLPMQTTIFRLDKWNVNFLAVSTYDKYGNELSITF